MKILLEGHYAFAIWVSFQKATIDDEEGIKRDS